MFEGKVALVTGAGSGIGRATAQVFAREGAKVTVADINEEGGAETVALIKAAGGEAQFVRTDVTVIPEIAAMVEKTLEAYGRLDAAVNNAGHPGFYTTALDCTEEEWDFAHAINLKSVLFCIQYEAKAMLKTGGGGIVNISSAMGMAAQYNMVSYVSFKHGVIGLTRSAGVDLSSKGVRVNAVLPGPTWTPMLQKGFEGVGINAEEFAQRTPIRRVGKAEEQAEAAVWLCSDRASFITGAPLSVDGGVLAV